MSLYRRLRATLSPIHPRRVWARTVHLVHRLGYYRVRLWVIALHPRRLAATVRWAYQVAATVSARRREQRLTVAVDISPFWEPLTGIGWYLYRLLEQLTARDDVRLRLYGPPLIDHGEAPPLQVALPAGPAIELVSYRIPADLSIADHYLAHQLRAGQAWLIAADGNDVLFAPNYFLPATFARCRGQLVATIHDLSVEMVPETMREATRSDLRRHLRATMARAARVLTDSATVREELIAHGLVEPARVSAVHLGPGSVTAASAVAAPPAGTPPVYVLHVGTLEPRKSVVTLLAAWRELARRGAAPPPLVLCGGLGWQTGELEQEMAAASAAGWLYHFGYLADAQVAALYRGALLVAVPSIYEGFGLPAVEAMGCGVPLLCSDIPVLREVAGDAAVYAPPRQPAAWADRLAELFADAELRAELGRRGRERAPRFDWRRTAAATVEVWRSAAGRSAARDQGAV